MRVWFRILFVLGSIILVPSLDVRPGVNCRRASKTHPAPFCRASPLKPPVLL